MIVHSDQDALYQHDLSFFVLPVGDIGRVYRGEIGPANPRALFRYTEESATCAGDWAPTGMGFIFFPQGFRGGPHYNRGDAEMPHSKNSNDLPDPGRAREAGTISTRRSTPPRSVTDITLICLLLVK